MKRSILLLLALVLVLGVLGGCSNSSSSSAPAGSSEPADSGSAAAAGDYTFTGPIHIMVPFKAGGGVDTSSRLLATGAEKYLGVKIVVDNKPGGNSLTGATEVLNGKADGYTLMANTCAGFIGAPQMYGNPFNPTEDWIPIVSQGTVPMIVCAGPSAPAKTMDEFLAYAKEHPGELTIGCAGYGDISGFSTFITIDALGIECEVVPFDGAAESTANCLGGHVNYVCAPASTVAGHVEEGTLIPLYETGGMESNPYNVPSISDLGHPEAATPYYRVLVAPKGTPDEVVAALRKGFAEILADPEVQKTFEDAKDPLMATITDSEELTARIQADYEAYGKVINDMGLAQ